MDRVIVTRCFVNIYSMQVCAVEDATDDEILEVCNKKNPSGTSLGWCKVIRNADSGDGEKTLPVQCADYDDRLHYLVTC